MIELLKNPSMIIIVVCIIMIADVIYEFVKKHIINKKIDQLANNALEVTPQDFFNIRNAKVGKNRAYISSDRDFVGVYIIYNNTKAKYYVGQSKNVLKRVNNHFNGHGNGDVYADYKYGDNFTIKMIQLKGSGFTSLNELERHTIERYNAFAKGYNKTRGNK